MPSGVGRTLREARIHAGVQLADVEAQTGVKAKYLRALEWERFDLLPSADFARHVAQAHAETLQLEPTLILAELEQTKRTLPLHGPTDGPPPTEPIDVGAQAVDTPPRPVAMATAAAAPQVVTPPTDPPMDATVVEPAAGATMPLQAPDDTAATQSHWPNVEADAVVETPVEAAKTRHGRRLLVGTLLAGLGLFLAVDLLILRDDEPAADPSIAAEAAPVEPVATADAPLTDVPADVDANAAASGDDPTSAGADHSPETTEAVATEEPGAPAPAEAAAAADGSAGADGPAVDNEQPVPTKPPGRAAVQEIEIAATRGTSWIQVRSGSRSGPVLFEGLLAGDQVLSYGEKVLFMRVGAAETLEISQDGKVVSEGLEGTRDLELTRKSGLQILS